MNKTQLDDRMVEIDNEFLRNHECVQDPEGSSFTYWKLKPWYKRFYWDYFFLGIFIVVFFYCFVIAIEGIIAR